MTDGVAGPIDVWAQGWRVWWQSDFGWAIDGCLRSYEPFQAQFEQPDPDDSCAYKSFQYTSQTPLDWIV
jgi:hypothetical protein